MTFSVYTPSIREFEYEHETFDFYCGPSINPLALTILRACFGSSVPQNLYNGAVVDILLNRDNWLESLKEFAKSEEFQDWLSNENHHSIRDSVNEAINK